MKNPLVLGFNFLKEVQTELKRITWPTRESIVGGTAAVFLVSAFTMVFVWIADTLVAKAMIYIMK